jgi:hypothetical protein
LGCAVVLAVVVVVMLRYRLTTPATAAVCVLFGLVLGMTPLGADLQATLTDVGRWMAAQLEAL